MPYPRARFCTVRSTVPVIRSKPSVIGLANAKETERPGSGTMRLSVSIQTSGKSEAWINSRSAGRSPGCGESELTRTDPR